jgi:hypothetical protein
MWGRLQPARAKVRICCGRGVWLKIKVLIVSSFLIFFGSMVISARSFYSGKPIKLRDAMISGILSPSDNPRGYRIAAAGTCLCGVLLLPVAFAFYRALSRRHRPLALLGTLTFSLGPLSAISMIFVTAEINDLHVYLATAAYFFMTAGLLICLALEGHDIVLRGVTGGGIRRVAMFLVLLFLFTVLVFLVYLVFAPDFFNDKNLLHNVAFDEWTLCAVVVAGISGLAMLLARPTR